MIFMESELVELKSEVVGDICKEVIAFANTKGGTLYIGVQNDGRVTGIENADKVTLQYGSGFHQARCYNVRSLRNAGNRRKADHCRDCSERH